MFEHVNKLYANSKKAIIIKNEIEVDITMSLAQFSTK